MDRRQKILSEADLLAAPRACQQAFWLRRNRETRRRPVVRLGDVAADVVDDAALAGAGQVTVLSKAWRDLLPREYFGLTAVEQYRDGRLLIMVDSAATKYALSRRLGDEFVAALNRAAARAERDSGRVRRIAFRVGLVQGVERTGGTFKGESRGARR